MRSLPFWSTVAAVVVAVSSARAADLAAGKEKAQICTGCHGENGISQMEKLPSLAGQLDQVIQWQLVYFRAGTRKNEQMQPIVEQLNNEDIRNLGAYFASLPPPKAPKDNNPDLSKKGAQAAAGRRCAACHTDTYAGSKAAARLAGQREDYLAKALQGLSQAGIVESTLGPAGGYRLAKAPEKISFLDVIEAVEGRTSTFGCRRSSATEPSSESLSKMTKRSTQGS